LQGVTATAGAALNQTAVTALPNPVAPVITQHGTPGTTTYTYYIVCKMRTVARFPARHDYEENALLDSANYNIIKGNCPGGYNGSDTLKGGTSGRVLLSSTIYANVGVKDTGQALSAYAPPIRNNTGDLSVAGRFSVNRAVISSGAGAPTDPCTPPAIYLRSDGGAGKSLYVCETKTWKAK
jgi:hypothetical protein